MAAKSRLFRQFLLVAFVCVAGYSLRPLALPGALGRVASQVRVGMSQEEVVAAFRAAGTDNVDCFYARGATLEGREFLELFGGAFDRLPPAAEVGWVELEVNDDHGRTLVVALGTGGVVSDVRLEDAPRLERWRFRIANVVR